MHYFNDESEDDKVDIYLSLGIAFYKNVYIYNIYIKQCEYDECINILSRSIKHAKSSKDLIKCEIYRYMGYSHYILVYIIYNIIETL